MTVLSENKLTQSREGKTLEFPVAASTKIYSGALICVNAAGYAVAGSDTAGLVFAGVAEGQADNSTGGAGDIIVAVRRRGLEKLSLGHAITQANIGDAAFISDDQTVDLAANCANGIFCGVIAGFISGLEAWVDIEPAIKQDSVDAHIADASGAHAASAISIADAGGFSSADNVETACAELYRDALSTAHVIPVCLGAVRSEDGSSLTSLAADAAPGFTQLDNKEVVLAWAANAAPLAASVVIPLVDPAINDAADVSVHVLAKMGGATDTPTLAYEAYIGSGDTDCAGTDPEITGGTALTEYVMTIAADDVPSAPSSLTLILTPTAGQMGTDALYVYAIWLTVTRKLRTS